MTFKKKDLIEILDDALGEANFVASKKQTEKILDRFLLNLETSIIENPEGIRLGKSGTFKIVLRKGRKGMNPRTQEPMAIPAQYTVIFRPSISIKKRLKKEIF